MGSHLHSPFLLFHLCYFWKKQFEAEVPLKWPLDLSVTRILTQRGQQGDFTGEEKAKENQGSSPRQDVAFLVPSKEPQ